MRQFNEVVLYFTFILYEKAMKKEKKEKIERTGNRFKVFLTPSHFFLFVVVVVMRLFSRVREKGASLIMFM